MLSKHKTKRKKFFRFYLQTLLSTLYDIFCLNAYVYLDDRKSHGHPNINLYYFQTKSSNKLIGHACNHKRYICKLKRYLIVCLAPKHFDLCSDIVLLVKISFNHNDSALYRK